MYKISWGKYPLIKYLPPIFNTPNYWKSQNKSILRVFECVSSIIKVSIKNNGNECIEFE